MYMSMLRWVALAASAAAVAGVTNCVDLTMTKNGTVSKWHLTFGEQYDCRFFAANGACSAHGHLYRNTHVANEACCTCGGGRSLYETPAPQCEDLTIASDDGPRKWHDAHGEEFTCEFYARNGLCGVHARNVYNASTACCVCGGGSTASPPAQCPPRVRHAWSSLSCAERQHYIDAVETFKRERPQDYDAFVNIHVAQFDYAHETSVFLPWHRRFLIGFENALRQFSGFECVTIPYWDWDADSGNETESHVFHEEAWGGSNHTDANGCVTKGRAAGWDANDGGCLTRNWNLTYTFTSTEEMAAGIMSYPDYKDFRIRFEAYPHAAPHWHISGHMARGSSPNDPLFFIHHANVDRLWAVWQNYHGHHLTDYFNLTEEHYYPAVDGGRRETEVHEVTVNSTMKFSDRNGNVLSYIAGDDIVYMMHDPTAVPRDYDRYTYGPDALAMLLGDPLEGEWEWVEGVQPERVVCPQPATPVPEPDAPLDSSPEDVTPEDDSNPPSSESDSDSTSSSGSDSHGSRGSASGSSDSNSGSSSASDSDSDSSKGSASGSSDSSSTSTDGSMSDSSKGSDSSDDMDLVVQTNSTKTWNATKGRFGSVLSAAELERDGISLLERMCHIARQKCRRSSVVQIPDDAIRRFRRSPELFREFYRPCGGLPASCQ